MILFATRCLLHTTCSVAVLLNKRRSVLFALPMALVSIKLTDWVVCRKRPGRINKAKKSTLPFLFRTDRKWFNKTRRQKNMFVFVSVGKLSYDCKPQNLPNITTWLQLWIWFTEFESPGRVPRETRASESCVALEVFSDRSAESDSSINLLTPFKIS